MTNSNDSPAVNKRHLYSEWLRNSRWRDLLHRKVAHKALDIPDDEMIEANRINVGIGWKELAVVGLLGLAATWLLWPKGNPAADKDTNTRYGFDIGGDPNLNPPPQEPTE